RLPWSILCECIELFNCDRVAARLAGFRAEPLNCSGERWVITGFPPLFRDWCGIHYRLLVMKIRHVKEACFILLLVLNQLGSAQPAAKPDVLRNPIGSQLTLRGCDLTTNDLGSDLIVAALAPFTPQAGTISLESSEVWKFTYKNP